MAFEPNLENITKLSGLPLYIHAALVIACLGITQTPNVAMETMLDLPFLHLVIIWRALSEAYRFEINSGKRKLFR